MNLAIRNLLLAAATVCVGAGITHAIAQAAEAPAVAPAAAIAEAIVPQPLISALNEFVNHTGLQVVYRSELAAGKRSRGADGGLPPRRMLEQLLRDTGLQFEFVNADTVTIRAGAAASARIPDASAAMRPDHSVLKLARAQGPAQTAQHATAAEESNAVANQTDDSKGVPEILVKGTRSSNTDIRRTEDDVQPYVVFDAEEIGRSMAPDLETFLRTRLPMNQSRGSHGQNVVAFRGNQSTINLRGLGANQTLILVNGRRIPGTSDAFEIYQPDINGIPLSAVERIEILPSTAGGIYGGGATGGVVNIILKRDYSDLELTARYDGTFAGGGAERRLDATAGLTLEGGRTSVMLMASYRDGNPLYVGDRDFATRARALQDENNREAFLALINPVHGYTTNIRSVSGEDLMLLDGLRSLNSPIAHVPVGYAGWANDNGAAFLGTAGRYNLALANDQLGSQYSLLNTPLVRSLQLSVRRAFTNRIEMFADVSRYDSRAVRMGSSDVNSLVNVTLPAGANNPFTGAVKLSVPLVGYETDALRTDFGSLSEQLTAGVIMRLTREWTLHGEYSWGRSSYTREYPSKALTADGSAALIDGRLDPLSDVNVYPLDFSSFYPSEGGNRYSEEYSTEQENATFRLSGPLLKLPGGPLRLAALLERREQYTSDQILAFYPVSGDAPTFTYYPEIGSSTDSAYAELNAPLVPVADARTGLLGLNLRVSYRYDATKTRTRPQDEQSMEVPGPNGPFPDVPFQTNKVTGNQYTLGFRYTPIESLALRASYGEGILPPTPYQLSELQSSTAFLGFLGYVDPKRGGLPIDGTTVEVFTFFSGNLSLRPEQSQSWSGGVIFTPARLPGLRLSVDYTRIEKTDEIGLLDPQVLIDREDDFPGVIVRNPLTPADEALLGYTGGTIRELRLSTVNIAYSLMEAFDIQADYRWKTRFGAFTANVVATMQPRLSQRLTPDSEELNNVGFSLGPLKWRANAGLRLSRGAWDMGWNMQYYDASRIYVSVASETSRDNLVLGQGSAWIPTQTYHDVYGRYRFENASGFVGGLLGNAELQISVQNVFNVSPPILASASAIPVAGYATEGDPRLRRYLIAFTKRFGR